MLFYCLLVNSPDTDNIIKEIGLTLEEIALLSGMLLLTLEALRGGGRVNLTPPPRTFGYKTFAPWPIVKSFGTLFLVCEHIFWHCLSDVTSDDAIVKSHANCVMTAKSEFFARNLLNTDNFTMDSNYFVDFNR